MNNSLFSIIGKRNSTNALSGTVPSLLGRMSDQHVVSEEPNEDYTIMDSVGSVPSLQTRIAPPSPLQQQSLSQRVAPHTTLLERMAEPISTIKGKGGHSPPGGSLVSRIYPSNLASSMSSTSSNESHRKRFLDDVAAPDRPPRSSLQQKAAVSVRPSINAEIISNSPRTLSPQLETAIPQASMEVSNPVPPSLLSRVSAFPPPVPESALSTSQPLNSVTSTSHSSNSSIFMQLKPTSSTLAEEMSSSHARSRPAVNVTLTGSDNMDIDSTEVDLTGEDPSSRVSVSMSPELSNPYPPLLVPITPQFLPNESLSLGYTFSSPIKLDDVTYDTLRFHMNDLWQESEAQAQEWREVAEQRARSRLLGDIPFEIRSSPPIQMKRNRQHDSAPEDIDLSEEGHVPKRQRAPEEKSLVQSASIEQIPVSIATQESKHREVVIDKALDTFQASKPLAIDQASYIAKRVHMDPSSPHSRAFGEEDITSEQDEQGEESAEEVERRVAEERTRIADEKAKEMRKNLEQELAIQRREQERSEQERNEQERKKEELEREARRLREDIVRRKVAKVASALPIQNISQVSAIVPASLPTPIRHPLPPKPATSGINTAEMAASQASTTTVGKKKSLPKRRPPVATAMDLSTPSQFPNLSPILAGASENNSFDIHTVSSTPANSRVPPSRTTTSAASWSLNQRCPISALPKKLSVSQGIDGKEKENAMCEDKNFIAHTSGLRKVEGNLTASASSSSVGDVFRRTTEGPNEMISSQPVQDSLPMPVIDTPVSPNILPNNTIQVSTPLSHLDPILSVKDSEKPSNIEGSVVSTALTSRSVRSTPPITQVKKEMMIQDDIAACSSFAVATFGSEMTTNVETLQTKPQVVGMASGSDNTLTARVSDSTTFKVEPSVEAKHVKKSPSPTPTIPTKRHRSPSGEPMVLKRQRDVSMGLELEYPETTEWGDPEVARSEKEECRQRYHTDHSSTPPPVNISLETLPPPQLHTSSPHGPRRRLRSRSRSRPRSLSRERQIDRARTPPKHYDYLGTQRRYYNRHHYSPSRSSPPRGRSPHGRSPIGFDRSRSPIRPISPLYDHWSPTPGREVRPTYPRSPPSYRPHRRLSPELQTRPRYSRSRHRSRDPSLDRTELPVAESSRPFLSESRTNVPNATPYYTSDRRNGFNVNQEPSFTTNENPPLKPYNLLLEDNSVLVPSPPPPRVSAVIASQPRRHLRRPNGTDRPGPSSSRGLYPVHTARASSPTARSPPPSPSRLADRISAHGHDILASKERGVPRERGTGSPRMRRTKLADRLSDIWRGGGSSLMDRIDSDRRL